MEGALCCNLCGHLTTADDALEDGVLWTFDCAHCGEHQRDMPFVPGDRQDAFNDLAVA